MFADAERGALKGDDLPVNGQVARFLPAVRWNPSPVAFQGVRTHKRKSKHCESIHTMHLTIVYRDILCDVGKGWFSTRLASEKPALLASYSFVSERYCFSKRAKSYTIVLFRPQEIGSSSV